MVWYMIMTLCFPGTTVSHGPCTAVLQPLGYTNELECIHDGKLVEEKSDKIVTICVPHTVEKGS